MKLFYVALFGWLAVQVANAQRVTFSRLPANGQLYPRNAQWVATIPVEGRIDTSGYERLSMLVYRNSTLYHYQNTRIYYDTKGRAPFALTTTIPAELAQYRIKLYLHSGVAGIRDSVLIADRQRIVTGDAYVISGQSNATAYNGPPSYTYQSEYVRTFGVYTAFDKYNPADTLWSVGNGSASALVGTWGMEVARQLTEQFGIPICIINGSAGGAPIQVLNARTSTNPMDLETNYGRLLYRVEKAGLTGKIKAYFYRQGENETSGWASGWPANFDYLFGNVRRDYPNLERFYLFQIHILAGQSSDTPIFRDYQRRLQTLQPLIRSIATVGTSEYDGIHFGVDGHRQTGLEVFRMVARDLYGSTDTTQIMSPDIKKVYYTSAARNELVLQFDEGQRMRWTSDTIVRDTYGDTIQHQLKQWMYLDKKAGQVLSGRAEGNRIILALNGSRTEQQLGYLPPNYPEQDASLPTKRGFAAAFPGPFLKNERGLRAFSFWNVPISAPPASLNNLTVRAEPDGTVRLAWADHPAEQRYVVERRQSSETDFGRIAELPANSVAYTDTSVTNQATYYYRLRAITPAAEAMASSQVTINCQVNTMLVSQRSGDWFQSRIWTCGALPTVALMAQVAAQHVVSVQQVAITRRLRLNGTLRFRRGGSLKLRQ